MQGKWSLAAREAARLTIAKSVNVKMKADIALPGQLDKGGQGDHPNADLAWGNRIITPPLDPNS